MNSTRFDVVGIGNAIFDIMSHVEEDFLVNENLVKGSMRLIDAEEADRLYELMGDSTSLSGGCAGNTVAGIASLGGSAAYIGKIADDQFGAAYRKDMHEIGAHFETSGLESGAPTARSMILVTPDGERTMNTFLGACVHLTENDVDPDVIGSAAITYMEGYLWDPEAAKDAFRKAMKIAHANNRKTALTLSDSFCVDRYREEFLHLIRNHDVDIVFSNIHELKALYQTSDLDSAISEIRRDANLAVITMGEKGSVCLKSDSTFDTNAVHVGNVVDLTGAGDLYASGFLLAFARNFPLDKCVEIASITAAEVISHLGPRPQVPLHEFVRLYGFEF